jgi:hypothetical protein
MLLWRFRRLWVAEGGTQSLRTLNVISVGWVSFSALLVTVPVMSFLSVPRRGKRLHGLEDLKREGGKSEMEGQGKEAAQLRQGHGAHHLYTWLGASHHIWLYREGPPPGRALGISLRKKGPAYWRYSEPSGRLLD